MTWAWRRRLLYLSVLALLFVVPASYFGYKALYRPPTCFDGAQNQNELGVDCGGVCVLLCYAEAVPPIVHWARAFKVSDGVYIAAAYIENPNEVAKAVNKPYEMEVYDPDGVPIYTRQGTVSLDPRELTAIIETGIVLNQREAAKVQFEWLGEAQGWERSAAEALALDVGDVRIEDPVTMPKVSAKIYNPTLETFRDFEVAALVYGVDGNAVGVSSTFIDRLAPRETRSVVFLWPKPFADTPVEAEVVPKI